MQPLTKIPYSSDIYSGKGHILWHERAWKQHEPVRHYTSTEADVMEYEKLDSLSSFQRSKYLD
jgi:hypothetical protein